MTTSEFLNYVFQSFIIVSGGFIGYYLSRFVLRQYFKFIYGIEDDK